MNKISTVNTMTFDGGIACLDFVNSGYDREKSVVAERLHNYEDLLTLTSRLALLDKRTLATLRKAAQAAPVAAEASLTFARKARTLLYNLFASLSQISAGSLEKDIMGEANQLFEQALHYQVLTNNQGLRFSYDPERAGLDAPMWHFVFSAYELIRDGNLQHIKQCQRCAWLFIDRTKSHRKKWCSMESCGNGQKVRRYYAKKKMNESKQPQVL